MSMGSLGVFVQEGLYLGVSIWEVSVQGVSVWGSVQEGLSLGSVQGFLSSRVSMWGVSVQGVSVWGSVLGVSVQVDISLSSGVCPWGLCLAFFSRRVYLGGLCLGGLSRGPLSGGLCPGGYVHGVSVQGFLCPPCVHLYLVGLCPEVSVLLSICPEGSLSRGISVQGGSLSREVCPWGLCLGVSAQWVSATYPPFEQNHRCL